MVTVNTIGHAQCINTMYLRVKYTMIYFYVSRKVGYDIIGQYYVSLFNQTYTSIQKFGVRTFFELAILKEINTLKDALNYQILYVTKGV